MKKINFWKNKYLKIYIVVLIAAFSYPLYSTSQNLFYFILLGIILTFLIIVDYSFFKKTYNNLGEWLLYRLSPPWYQLITIYLIILLILDLVGTTKYNNFLPLIIVFCWILPLITVIAVSRNIFSLIMKIREMANERKLFSLKIIVLSFLTLVVTFFAPDLAFAFGYSIFLATFENIELEMLDTYYLSLIISNTLPLGEPFTDYITIIGKNSYIYLFQTVHVFSNKIINWVVIGVVFNYIFLAIDSRQKN